MKPFRYKGKVIGKTAWEKALKNVIAAAREKGRESRVKVLENPSARKSCWHAHDDCNLPGGLYQSRYGDDWKNKLPKGFTEVSITTVMDHVIAEGNCLFADTPFSSTWKIYHYALP